jgi:hypothetical protein
MHKRTWPRIEDRICDAVIVDEDGCWNWTGSKTSDGYGRISYHGATYTHRVAYEVFVGPIPEGYEVDHLCRNTSCCNPGHLEPVTPQENLSRREGPLTCRKQHDESFIYITSAGRKSCRACRNERKRRYRTQAA